MKSNAYNTAQFVAQESGMLELLKGDKSIEGIGRLENLNSLLDGIKEFVEEDVMEQEDQTIPIDKSLSQFLQTISLMTDADEKEENPDTVTLMSVHSAKGLEFKSVFVVGLEENLFPSYMALSDPTQIDEERRLFYVAITRAEEYLCLTYAHARYQYGQMRFNDPSRFLEEISNENIDALISIQDRKKDFPEPKILGNFKALGQKKPAIAINPADFKPAQPQEIKPGHTVLHLKFGQGKVISVDERLVASIVFDDLSENQEKRIMLQFAKLQIMG